MNEWLVLCFGLLSILSGISGQNVTRVSDPLVNIFPLKTTAQFTNPTSGTKEAYRQSAANYKQPKDNFPIDQQNPVDTKKDIQVGEESRIASGPLTIKRNANGRQITVTSHLQEEESLREEQKDKPTEDIGGSCTYTFVVSKKPETNSNTCGQPHASGPSQNEQLLTTLHQDIVDAKSRVEDIMREMLEERQDIPSSNSIKALEGSVSLLQQESRNMDSRVSQLYMQLLHEIINKRDNSLEIQRMENKILNLTVDYYKLKEEHEQLKRNHVTIMTQMEEQAQHLSELITFVDDFKKQHGEIVDPLLEVKDRRQKPLKRTRKFTTPASPTRPTARPLRLGPFRDCTEVQRAGHTRSGTFSLRIPGHRRRIRVWCDFEQDPGGWIVIQRRTGRRINFYRNMASYKAGFGRPHSDFWLGLERIHQLTTQEGVNFKLHIDLEDWNDKKTFVEYQSFRVEAEDTGYRLKVTHYSGNAGDSLTWHNNMRFTTSDQDNDPFEGNCAHYQRGGWWYNTCARSNLNGIYYKGGHYRSQYQDGVYWAGWRGESYSLKSVSMKIMATR